MITSIVIKTTSFSLYSVFSTSTYLEIKKIKKSEIHPSKIIVNSYTNRTVFVFRIQEEKK